MTSKDFDSGGTGQWPLALPSTNELRNKLEYGPVPI